MERIQPEYAPQRFAGPERKWLAVEAAGLIPGSSALVVSRWHCMQISICNFEFKRAGLTMAARISGCRALPPEARSACREPGP